MKPPANGVAAIYLLLHCVSGSVLSEYSRPSDQVSGDKAYEGLLAESSALQSSSPFMSLPRNFWQEISIPYTDLPNDDDEQEDESAESTTHDPYPFFDDANMVANVTTQLGSDVYLHCRVNDLRERTVSIEQSIDGVVQKTVATSSTAPTTIAGIVGTAKGRRNPSDHRRPSDVQ
uniref:Ig-like domain-containing protein n=1 Tax=Anopheles maculatus TaxID=74869 RepID=A0A182TC20_9DIPT